jgi:hypothetical protein
MWERRDGHRPSVCRQQPSIDQACIPVKSGVCPTFGEEGAPWSQRTSRHRVDRVTRTQRSNEGATC